MSDPKPYQLAGARWLADRKRALLGDVPGLGKTRQALLGAHLRGARRLGILAPANAVAVWERELTLSGLPLALQIASYDQYRASATAREAMKVFAPDVMVLDEFHYLANEHAQRSEVAYAHTRAMPVVWGLSGTPMPRHPGQLYAIADAFWPASVRGLGIDSYYDWLAHFTVWKQGTYGPRIFAAKNVPQLRKFLDGKMLRRNEHSAGVVLPPLRWTVGLMSPDIDAATRAYEIAAELTDRERELIASAEGMGSAHVARARHQLGDLKAPIAAALIVRELAHAPSREKRVVFAYHRSVLDVLQRAFERAGLGIARIDGDKSTAERREAEERFQHDAGTRVFLGQTAAAATAITLTAAHRADIVEPDWRTDMNVQDGKRVHRIGQTHSSWVRMLAVADTLDEAIVDQHHREIKIVERIVD